MDFPFSVFDLRQRLGLTQAEMGKRLGISSNYVSLLESESSDKKPGESLLRHLELIDKLERSGFYRPKKEGEPVPNLILSEEPSPYRTTRSRRRIPILGWAHGGEPENYEEVPTDWQEEVPTDCRDPKAFGVRLEGDSMAREYLAGDVLILMPSNEIYNGCLAVIKLRGDGYIFRQVERRAGFLRLIPLNERWEIEELPLDQVEWAYPLYAMYRQVTK